MATGKSRKIISPKRRGPPAKKNSQIIGGIHLGVGLKKKFLARCDDYGCLPTRVIAALVAEWTEKGYL